MPTKVTMPQLGESVTEGTIGKWLVQPGDRISQYEPLCEVITDKVNAEVPSSFEGEMTEIVAKEGETVQVGGLICYIEKSEKVVAKEESGEKKHKGTQDTQDHGTSQTSEALYAESNGFAYLNDAKPKQRTEHMHREEARPTSGNMKKRYSPAVLKLSQEHDIDLDQVQGTGKSGRITRKDLLKIIEAGNIPEKAERHSSVQQEGAISDQADFSNQYLDPSTEQSDSEASSPISIHAVDREIPVKGVRRATAHKMVQSKKEIPHAWTMVEVDVTDLVKYRGKIKADFNQQEGINLTFLPFFIKATVEALKDYPLLNSQWAGDRIIQKKDIHISIAVAAEDELYVPVIRQADEKSVAGLAKAIQQLAHKTRTHQLTQQDTQGGTFTVNNTGSFGSIQSQPIINYPQAAILSVESIVQRPVIKDGMIAIRDMVNLCLSLDHRVLDGLTCGRFLQSIKSRLENMGEGTGLY